MESPSGAAPVRAGDRGASIGGAARRRRMCAGRAALAVTTNRRFQFIISERGQGGMTQNIQCGNDVSVGTQVPGFVPDAQKPDV